ncbi:cytidylyltransferase domain-containing protein [Gracilinema caldarium]|uniref:cytidylyltransferase domain-containing protein n=1 Tax=Gracilinema caldarium TaxID=215591 RepID=UPI0026EC7AA6|nr:spore coat protein [Gracilinema caldarium]
MNFGVIVQARLDSSRLPRKALLPLHGEPLLFRVLEALSFIPVQHHILACPEDSYEAFKPIAEVAGFDIIAGPKDDVLRRFVLACKAFALDYCIRATADNPFVFTDAAWMSAQESIALEADYGTLTSMPYGSGVEIIKAEALFRADRESSSSYDREHVCPYLYNNPNIFYLHRPLCPLKWREPQVRLTVDTYEDYERAQRLYPAITALAAENKNDIPLRYRGETILKAYHNKEVG